MGGVCFAEGMLACAAALWTVGPVLFFLLFPVVEGDPSLRKGRLLADAIAVLFFIMTSALVLISRSGVPGYSFIVMAGAICLHLAAVAGQKKKKK